MGCGSCQNIALENTPYFNAYNSIKTIMNAYKFHNIIELDVFLISTKSIPNFLDCITSSNIEFSSYDEEFLARKENELKKYFLKYKLEENIKIYSDYDECLKISKNKEKQDENEFIMVNQVFVINMKIKNDNLDKKRVLLKINREDKKNQPMKIYFLISQKEIEFRENENGYFSFVEPKNNSNNNQEFNPPIQIFHK